MPSAMGVALGALSAERSGAGSALLTAMRQVGSTIGVAVLGTVISNRYGSGVAARRPASRRRPRRRCGQAWARASAVAGKLGSSSLLDTVRSSFVHGMDLMLWTCGGIAVACALLAVLFLPRRTRPQDAGDADLGFGSSRFASGRCKGQNQGCDGHDRAGQPAGAEEGQDACFPAGARAPAVPRAGLSGDHGGADRRGGRGVAVHVLPVLPDEGRRGPPGRHGHPAGGGVRQAAAGPRARSPRSAPRCGRPGRSFTPAEWEQIREGGRLSMEVPEIRARTMNEFARTDQRDRRGHRGPHRPLRRTTCGSASWRARSSA